MKFATFGTALFVAAFAAPAVLAMTCPDGTSPGTSFCSSSCGCYCGGDNRVHCDELSNCQQSSGSAKQFCIANCSCP
ncbi:hypothetical protein OC835_004735 [Tilletia horrida]|nr:hypothetical protein OC835_004735 [Tilletia horrida]KAK0563132.1 hypothetical protein OC844_002359 [Tilletia horrida]